MLLLIKLVELFIIIMVVKTLIGIFISRSRKSDGVYSQKKSQSKRFNSAGEDISDGDFKEIR